MARGQGRRWRRNGDEVVFPGFSDVAEIGRGGFSTVYRAREDATDRPVALKLLRVGPQVTGHALESFRRESLALGALSAHPNIVTLYRTLTTPSGRPVLVLELCRGSMAGRLAADGRCAPEEVVSIAVRLAGALATAHEVGMLHRDVKPQNVLLTEFGEPALADFGVARLQAAAEQATGAFGFTTLHAPPELLEGAPASAATDVYELASTCYQLLTGRPAFHLADDEDPAAAAARILRAPVRPISLPGVPAALSDLLVAAMAKEPDDRPASARAFAAALQALAAESGWAPTRAVTRDGFLAGAPSGRVAPAPTAPAAQSVSPLRRSPPTGAAPPGPSRSGHANVPPVEHDPAPTMPRGSAGVRRPASLVPPPAGTRRVLWPPAPPPAPPPALPSSPPASLPPVAPASPLLVAPPTQAPVAPLPAGPPPAAALPPAPATASAVAAARRAADAGVRVASRAPAVPPRPTWLPYEPVPEPARSVLEETRLRPGLVVAEPVAGSGAAGAEGAGRRRPWWRGRSGGGGAA